MSGSTAAARLSSATERRPDESFAFGLEAGSEWWGRGGASTAPTEEEPLVSMDGEAA